MINNQFTNNFLKFLCGISICSFLLFTFSVFILKDSYAIPTDENGAATSTFTSNYSGSSSSLVNYIEQALTSSYENRKFFTNFSVPKNYRTSDNSAPLYVLTKNSKFARTTESFEMTSGNPANVSDNGIKYILANGYNSLNAGNIFSKGTHGVVSDNNIKHYITQVALWVYLLENKDSFTSNYCPTVNIHMSDSDTTPDSFTKVGGCDFYHYIKSDTYQLETADVNSIKKIISDASSKSGYDYLGYITELVDGANKARSSSNDSVGVTLSSNNSISYFVSPDGKYLITDAISPTSTNPDYPYLYYSVEVVDPNNYGAYISDSKGNQLHNTTNMSGSFNVYIPLNDDIDLSTIQVKVTASFIKFNGSSYRVTKTTSNDPTFDNTDKKQNFSDVLLGVIPTQTAETTMKLKNLTKISKIDAANSKELPGAELVIKRQGTDDVVEKWVSTSTPKFIYLDEGDYTLCETVAPKGYTLNTECIDFTVDGTKVTSVTMKNSTSVKVKVPNTESFLDMLPYLIGGGILIFGILITVFTLYKKKNENIN